MSIRSRMSFAVALALLAAFLSLPGTGTARAAAPVRAAVVTPTHVLVFGGLENKGDVSALKQGPYLRSVAAANVHFTKVKDSLPGCPSLPHYLIYAFGDNFGVCDDGLPNKHPINHPSVWSDALRSGNSAKIYVQSATSNCPLVDQGPERARHDYGWNYSVFSGERTQCQQNMVPMVPGFYNDLNAGNLPTISAVTWDLNHDGHKPSTMAIADNYMSQELPKVLASPQYQDGSLLVIIPTDEASGTRDPNILCLVLHKGTPAKVISTALTQESIYVSLKRYAGSPTSGADLLAVAGL